MKNTNIFSLNDVIMNHFSGFQVSTSFLIPLDRHGVLELFGLQWNFIPGSDIFM